MLPQAITLTALSAERARQDQVFEELCATLGALEPELRFRVSEASFAELEAAWTPKGVGAARDALRA